MKVTYYNHSTDDITSGEEGSAGSFIDINNLHCISIAYEADTWLTEDINSFAKRYKYYIVLGIGGSSLSGQAIKCMARSDKVIFLDNICPYEFCEPIDRQLDETGIIVISKSGETIETLAQLDIALQRSSDQAKQNNFLVITENKPSTLKKICEDYRMLFVEHPSDIGGRFSVFSPVGLLPAYIMGVDVSRMKHGAIDAIKSKEYIEGSLFSTNDKCLNQVFFSYSSRLKKLGEWIAQLYAESSGKGETGITPLLATGTTDQHSQLQLYLGGQKNKAYTFFIEDSKHLQRFSNDLPIETLHGHTLNDLFMAEAYATVEAIKLNDSQIRTFESGNITEYELGWLFMHFMLEIIYSCSRLKVDPFGQPHVEIGKKLARGRLTSDVTICAGYKHNKQTTGVT